MPGVGEGPDRFFLIVLDLADPGHAETTGLDDHVADGLKEFVLASGANQSLIATFHRPEDPVEPLFGLPACGDVMDAGGEHRFFAGLGGEEAGFRHESLPAGVPAFDFETLSAVAPPAQALRNETAKPWRKASGKQLPATGFPSTAEAGTPKSASARRLKATTVPAKSTATNASGVAVDDRMEMRFAVPELCPLHAALGMTHRVRVARPISRRPIAFRRDRAPISGALQVLRARS